MGFLIIISQYFVHYTNPSFFYYLSSQAFGNHSYLQQQEIRIIDMLVIKSMQVLYKDTAIMESIFTHKTKIRLQINGMKSYESQEVPVKEKLAHWEKQPIYVTELPKDYNSLNLQFFFYKNNQEVGKAKCKAVYGRNRKDCLDIANRNFQIVGKFLFQTEWNISQQVYNYSPNMYAKETFKSQVSKGYSNYPELNEYTGPKQLRRQQTMPNYDINYSQQNPYLQKSASTSQYRPPNLNKPYFKNVELNNQSRIEKEKKPKKNKGFFGMFGGCFGCYGAMRKQKRPFFVIDPIVIDTKDLPYAAPASQEPFSIQYYSKQLSLSQKSS